MATCRRTVERPHLDGNLDDPIWQTADRLFLRNGVNALPLPLGEGSSRSEPGEGALQHNTEVRITRDDEFLYLAIHCPKAANLDYHPDDSPRPRDADLTQHDRVSIRLDIDRDYTTAYELTVDNRGWTHDSCGATPPGTQRGTSPPRRRIIVDGRSRDPARRTSR